MPAPDRIVTRNQLVRKILSVVAARRTEVPEAGFRTWFSAIRQGRKRNLIFLKIMLAGILRCCKVRLVLSSVARRGL